MPAGMQTFTERLLNV